jgi:hypothetical protein
VLTSEWAYLFGVPTAYFGLALSVGFLLLALIRAYDPFAWSKLVLFGLTLGTLATVASIAFAVYSVTQLKSVCVWCVSWGALVALQTGLHALLLGNPYSSRMRVGSWGSLLASAGIAGFAFMFLPQKQLTTPYDPVAFSRINASEWIPADAVTIGTKLDSPNADFNLVVFADEECFACRRLTQETLKYLPQDDKIGLVYRHMPRSPRAFELAVAAEVAAGRGELRAYLLGQTAVAASPTAQELSGAETRVRRDLELARRAGFKSTPTVVVVLRGRSVAEVVQPQALNSIVRL